METDNLECRCQVVTLPRHVACRRFSVLRSPMCPSNGVTWQQLTVDINRRLSKISENSFGKRIIRTVTFLLSWWKDFSSTFLRPQCFWVPCWVFFFYLNSLSSFVRAEESTAAWSRSSKHSGDTAAVIYWRPSPWQRATRGGMLPHVLLS